MDLLTKPSRALTYPRFARVDLSDRRRVLVAGDIHGHLDLLLSALENAEYDPDAGDQCQRAPKIPQKWASKIP